MGPDGCLARTMADSVVADRTSDTSYLFLGLRMSTVYKTPVLLYVHTPVSNEPLANGPQLSMPWPRNVAGTLFYFDVLTVRWDYIYGCGISRSRIHYCRRVVNKPSQLHSTSSRYWLLSWMQR